MTAAEVGAKDDLVVEKQIRDAVAGIEMHVTGLEGLLCKFYDDTPEGPDQDDGGAGLAHLEVLSSVFDDLIGGRLTAGWENDRIWSEKERDTWSPFATEVTNHVYAIPPLVLRVQELREQTTKPYGFSNLANLSYRVTSLFEHTEPEPGWVEMSRVVSRNEDEEAYEAYTEPFESDEDDDDDAAAP